MTNSPTQSRMDLASGKTASVDCLGMSFADDNERRTYFRTKLREFLGDPEFRARDGFPVGTDDAIVEMSDPPYYTACPNPFIKDFLGLYGSVYDPTALYLKEPLAIDVTVGKTDPLYKAHSYHTKVPHKAIVPSILHYTKPGDVILDAFAGSGMTGVAAAICSNPPQKFRFEIEQELRSAGRPPAQWGERIVVLNDLSPAASFISYNYNMSVDSKGFSKALSSLFSEVHKTTAWMYETLHTDGSVGQIEYTVWSQVFGCPECAEEIIFSEAEKSDSDVSTRKLVTCPKCDAELKKSDLDVRFISKIDPTTGEAISDLARKPVLIVYRTKGRRCQKTPDAVDMALVDKLRLTTLPASFPTVKFPFDDMWEAARLRDKGIVDLHHMFLPRSAHALGLLWSLVEKEPDIRIRNMLKFTVEQGILTMSVLNRYRPDAFSQFNQFMSGVYYAGSEVAECSISYAFSGKVERLDKLFEDFQPARNTSMLTTGSATCLPIPNETVDYIFTDPPFGDNLPYAELNFPVEAFHGVMTRMSEDAIVDRGKRNKEAQKSVDDYRNILTKAFSEYCRVLKPGRWMTVVFSNTSAAVWNAIQVAIQEAGFVVANVSTLDKVQLGFKAVTTTTAVKQDLVISAYKPNGGLEQRFVNAGGNTDSIWDFVETHLKNLPISKMRGGALDDVPERDPRRIFDRMVAWFVKHNAPVPLSSSEFQSGIAQRFPERDGMVFLPAQVDEYDKRRLSIGAAPQRDLFVDDERSAIDWLSDFIKSKPSTSQEINPFFTQKLGAGWRKYEQRPEMAQLLEDNFLKYDGTGPVPNQIHAYLSSNWRELRGLDKNSPALIERAKDRWYVGDPNKQQDVEKRRDKALLKEFERYRSHTGKKLKEVRLEVLRAGFKAAWAAREYKVILDVADRVAEDIWQEDEKLLTFYDMAETRLRAGK